MPGDDDINIEVRLRDALSRDAGQAENALEDLSDAVGDLNTDLTLTDPASRRAAAGIDAVGDEAKKTEREMRALRKAMREATASNDALSTSMLSRGQRAQIAFRRSMQSASRSVVDGTSKANTALRKFGGELKTFAERAKKVGASLMKLFKFPAIIAGVTLVSGAVSALAAAAVAGVAALTPLISLLAVIPAVGIAAKSSTALIKASVKPATEAADAIKKYGENSKEAVAALKKVAPEGRGFVKQLALMKAAGDRLRTMAQKGMLPGFEDGLRRALTLTPIVGGAVQSLSGVLGRLAIKGSQVATTPFFKKDLETIGRRNSRVVAYMGDTAIILGDALRHVVVEAGPMVESLVLMVRHGAELTRAFLSNARASGKLGSFFESTERVLRGVVGFLADVSVGLVNVFKGGADLGGEMGKSIGDLAQKFRDWSGSVEGQNAIKKFFDDAKPVIKEASALVGDLIVAFGSLANNGELAPLLKKLRTELLPAVTTLANSLTDPDGLASAFIDMATAFVTFNSSLSFSPLVEVTKTVASAAVAIS